MAAPGAGGAAHQVQGPHRPGAQAHGREGLRASDGARLQGGGAAPALGDRHRGEHVELLVDHPDAVPPRLAWVVELHRDAVDAERTVLTGLGGFNAENRNSTISHEHQRNARNRLIFILSNHAAFDNRLGLEGEFDIFLVPIGKESDGYRYEAIYNFYKTQPQ